MSDLLFEVSNSIATITLNRPEKKNAFSEEMITKWISSLEHIRDSNEIKAAVVKGNGTGFCAGGDIKVMNEGKGFFASEQDFSSTALARKNSLWKMVQRIPLLLEEIDKPIIAQIHGYAFGAGLDMALMCDIRIAGESTKFSESYVRVGIVPGDGGCYYLPRLIGIDQALDLLWTGKVLSASEAKEKGIVTYVIPDDKLEQFTQNYVNKIIEGPTEVIQIIKRAVYQGQKMDLRSSLDYISSAMGIVTELPNYKEGVQSFLESEIRSFNNLFLHVKATTDFIFPVVALLANFCRQTHSYIYRHI